MTPWSRPCNSNLWSPRPSCTSYHTKETGSDIQCIAPSSLGAITFPGADASSSRAAVLVSEGSVASQDPRASQPPLLKGLLLVLELGARMRQQQCGEKGTCQSPETSAL